MDSRGAVSTFPHHKEPQVGAKSAQGERERESGGGQGTSCVCGRVGKRRFIRTWKKSELGVQGKGLEREGKGKRKSACYRESRDSCTQ